MVVTKQNGATLEMELDDTFGPGASQKEVYQRMIQDPVGRVTQGYNATVFAYGQTGTGKTYTAAHAIAGSTAGLVGRLTRLPRR